jgi:hypothetical protein
MPKTSKKVSPYSFILNPQALFVKTVVADLGTNVNAIRMNLKKKNLKGIPEDVNACVLANYFWKNGFEDVSFDGDLNCSEGAFKLPKPYHAFVRNFDEGKFPELVED